MAIVLVFADEVARIGGNRARMSIDIHIFANNERKGFRSTVTAFGLDPDPASDYLERLRERARDYATSHGL